MSFEYTPYLDRLFDGAEARMWDLVNAEGYFTNYAFIRKTMQDQKAAYIEFLAAMLADRGDEYPFNLVHQAIGLRLSEVAPRLGYEPEPKSGVKDVDIFGTGQNAKLYWLTDAVCDPR